MNIRYFKLCLGLIVGSQVISSLATAAFNPPYNGEPRTLEEIQRSFQDFASATNRCPEPKQISQKLFDDRRFKDDVLQVYSNRFGTISNGSPFSNAFPEANVILNVIAYGCSTGESPNCNYKPSKILCEVYKPVHWLPNANDERAGKVISGIPQIQLE